MILADASLLPAPLQYGLLGVLFAVLTGMFALVREIITRRDTTIDSLIAKADAKDERVLTVLSDAAVAQVALADLGKRYMERNAIAEDRERERRQGGH